MTHTILYPIPSLKVGGAEQQLLELVRSMDKARFHPIVVTLEPGGRLESEFRAIPGLELIQLHRRGKFDFSPVWRIAAILRSRHVDLVHPMLSPMTSMAMLSALMVGTPVKIQSERSGRRLEMNFHLHMQDFLTRFAQYVVTNSEAGRECLIDRRVPAHKIVVIENGINRDRLQVNPEAVAAYRRRLGVPERGHVVGILASLIPLKRHDTLLQAAAILRAKRDDVYVAVFGDGELRQDLQAMAERLQIADHVVFFGNQRNVADCLAACTVLVSLSTMEGLSNSILEAMTLNVPAIGTNIPGTRELIEHHRSGALIPVGDAAALARELEFVFDHPEATQEWALRGKEMIDTRFSLQRMVARHEALYESLLVSPRQRFIVVES